MLKAGRTARFTARLLAGQDGGGTALAIIGVLAVVMLSGLAIDSGNAWRMRERMQIAADAAAYAGVVALASGRSESDSRAAVLASIDVNLPELGPREEVGAAAREIDLVYFDTATGKTIEIGPTNAVRVTLRRARGLGNAVPTFLLGLFGIPDWNIAVAGVAAVAPTARCDGNAGIYARGRIIFGASNSVGSAYCLHSQTSIDLAGTTSFEPGSRFSQPNLESCMPVCDPARNPGMESREINLIMPRPEEFVAAVYSEFADAAETDRRKAFFAARPLAADLSALAELGIGTADLRGGDIVELDLIQANQIREFPAGLTYAVRCDGAGDKELVFQGFGTGPTVRNVAVVTDCPIRFDAMSEVTGSLIVTESDVQGAAVSADDGARLGDPGAGCAAGSRSWVLAAGALAAPAGLAAGNATFVTAGPFDLAATEEQKTVISRGMAVHAGGGATLEGQYRFETCPDAETGLTPSLEVIRQVMARRDLPEPPAPGQG